MYVMFIWCTSASVHSESVIFLIDAGSECEVLGSSVTIRLSLPFSLSFLEDERLISRFSLEDVFLTRDLFEFC